jgi:hypothetical protein
MLDSTNTLRVVGVVEGDVVGGKTRTRITTPLLETRGTTTRVSAIHHGVAYGFRKRKKNSTAIESAFTEC